MLALAAVLIAGAVTWANAAPLHRLSADFQNLGTTGSDEIFTNAAPLAGGAGGAVKYTKVLTIPFKVVYITFSGQADVHNGSALLMNANIVDSAGVVTQCNIDSGLPSAGPSGWATLLKLPAPTASTNCDDGGGGTGDCHDNTIMFSCCVQITPDTEGDDTTPATTHTVNIKLADRPGGGSNFALYERSTIYIDASPNPGGNLCTGHGSP